MIYLGDGIYSDSGPYIQHYGVMGMKWGVRKDKEFRRDLHRHAANEKIREARNLLRGKSIDKNEFKRRKKMARAEEKANNAAMKFDYKGMKPQKGVSRKTIYEANMKKAQDTIPHYKAKHAARKAVRIATGAAIGVGAAYAGILGAAGAATMAAASSSAAMQAGAQMLSTGLGYGIGTATGAAIDRKIGQKIINNKM